MGIKSRTTDAPWEGGFKLQCIAIATFLLFMLMLIFVFVAVSICLFIPLLAYLSRGPTSREIGGGFCGSNQSDS